jgi:hypothetical protein
VSDDGCAADCTSEAPLACTEGMDMWTNAKWVVCEASAQEAWLSANTSGQYHPVAICQELGYNTVGQYGGTWGKVCGINVDNNPSCQNPGTKSFSIGNWNGQGNCGSDGNGPIICNTVMWTCVP